MNEQTVEQPSVVTALDENLPLNEAEKFAVDTRICKNAYIRDIVLPLPEKYDYSEEEMPEKLWKEIQESSQRWATKDYKEFIQKADVYIDDEKIKGLYGEFNHDMSVVTQYLTLVLNDRALFDYSKHYVIPPVVNFPAHTLERLARRLENKKVPISFDPGEICKNIADFSAAFLANKKEVKVEYKPLSDEAVNLVGDELDFEAVVFNLTRNVVKRLLNPKYHGTKLIIQANNVGGKYVVEIIDDTGGFAPELLEEVTIDGKKIQKAFIKGVASGSEEGKGFGLAIAKEVVDDYKGEILIEPTKIGEKEGSIIRFSIPIIK